MDVTYGTVWNDCLEVIREQVESENFNTWFKPIVPLRVDGDVLTIQVPSQFFYEWLEENYVPVLRKAIHTVLGPTGRLEYSVIVDSGNQTHPPVAVNYPNTLRRSAVNAPPADDYSPFTYKALNPQKINSRLNPNYTFDNFVRRGRLQPPCPLGRRGSSKEARCDVVQPTHAVRRCGRGEDAPRPGHRE